MGDAMLIETYAGCVQAKTPAGQRFAFVTHNKHDFSVVNGNQRLPHPDIAGYFSRIKSLYFINLPELLRRIEPSLVSDVMFELSWTQDPRGLSEILKAEDLLFHQVWYNRHWGLRIGVREGRIKVVKNETYPNGRRAGDDSARRVEWRVEGRPKNRARIRQEEPRAVGRFRVGHDQRQAIGPPMGPRRRVGRAVCKHSDFVVRFCRLVAPHPPSRRPGAWCKHAESIVARRPALRAGLAPVDRRLWYPELSRSLSVFFDSLKRDLISLGAYSIISSREIERHD